MAAIGDWIKMRSCLLNHPKVIGMVNYLIKEDDFFIFVCGAHTFANREEGYTVTDYVTKTTLRYVTVSALLSLWSSARLHSDNGILYGLKLSDLDDMAGVPCFGKALESVGWASVCNDTQAVILSNFTEWNEQVHRGPVKSNAERQKEWRSRQKNTVTKRNESNDREEKRREENIECVSNITETSPVETHAHNSSKGLTEAERIHRSYCLRRWGDSWDADQESAKSLKEIREIESRLEAMPSARSKLEAYFANTPPGRLATEPLYQIFQYLELDQKNAEKKQSQRPSQTYKDFTAERLASQFKA